MSDFTSPVTLVAEAYTGTHSGSTGGTPVRLHGKFDAQVHGTFTATVKLQRARGDAQAVPADADFVDVAGESYTAATAKVGEAASPGWYRWKCSAYTSGTINVVLAQ